MQIDEERGARLANRPQLAVREGGHTLATKRKVEGLRSLWVAAAAAAAALSPAHRAAAMLTDALEATD